MKWNGKKLSIECDRRSVSPAELAERLGVSRQAVYGWLSGRDPRGSHLVQLTEFLKIDPAELYDREAVSVRQKYIENLQAASVSEGGGGKLFKRSGIKLIYAILTDPMLGNDPHKNRINCPVRDLARDIGLSTGSVSELFTAMKERSFILTEGRMRILINRQTLFDKWLNGYMDYRFRVKSQCFKSDTISWWQKRLPEQEGFLWGGEPAASVLTQGYLRPQNLTLYTSKPLYDLVVDGNLHQVSAGGNVEFVAPLIRTEDGEQGCVHPLLVYADLICSADDRNIETAKRIYDKYLREIIETD